MRTIGSLLSSFSVLVFACQLWTLPISSSSPQLCTDTDSCAVDDSEGDISDLLQRSVRPLVGSDTAQNQDVRDTLREDTVHVNPVWDSFLSVTSAFRGRHFSEVMGSITHWTNSLPDQEKKAERFHKWDAIHWTTIMTMLFVIVCFDVFVVPKMQQTMKAKFFTLALMVVLSALFSASIYIQRGKADCMAWVTGYVVEIALSMDNLFVFHLVFKTFQVKRLDQATYALSIGIYGAIVLRVVFIVFLSALFEISYVVDFMVGLALILSGILTACDDEDQDASDLYTVSFFKWVFGKRLKDKETTNECTLFAKDGSGQTQITILCLVVCVISVADVFFALDSVGSKTGQIKSVYINLSSSLMAMFSLRALFFILKDLDEYFGLVKYGICAILCFVGVEMIASSWYPLPIGVLCIVIASLFVASVIASILKVVWDEQAKGASQRQLFREGGSIFHSG